MNSKIIGAVIVMAVIIGGILFMARGGGPAPAVPGDDGITGQVLPTGVPQTDTFTLDEVAAHSTPADCWTAVNGKVYDLTGFISDHPGGEVITGVCGRDGTIEFTQRPNTAKSPHPSQANEQLDRLYIGDLAD